MSHLDFKVENGKNGYFIRQEQKTVTLKADILSKTEKYHCLTKKSWFCGFNLQASEDFFDGVYLQIIHTYKYCLSCT